MLFRSTFAQDRFFAYADAVLVDQVRMAAVQGLFAHQYNDAMLHAGGATSTYKQIQPGEANVQLTFHEDSRKQIEGCACIVVEPEIDYYKDLGAHTLLEVIPNSFFQKLKDRKIVYALRWTAGRRAESLEFDPPYAIESE